MTSPSASNLVLVINSGSSSLKYQLLDAVSAEVMAKGLCERIGEPTGVVTHEQGGREYPWNGPLPDHGRALEVVNDLFAKAGTALTEAGVGVVGHRLVHGGDRFSEPVLIDDTVLATVRELAVLAPLHNPANATGAEFARKLLPDVPHVGVFDTGFFADLPAAAATYAINHQVAKEQRIRRYGFHGTSHQFVSKRAAEFVAKPYDQVDQIVLHLGNGASASAIKGGRPLDTSMGLTPLEGLVMGTRCGDIDAGILFHLKRQAGMDVEAIDKLLNKQSGLLGLAGVSDLRDIDAGRKAGKAECELAFQVYCHRIRKYVGAYLAVLGGADVITFTAGVGENDSAVRAGALSGLERFGIEIDLARNELRSREARQISTENSHVKVLVIPTNEELEIARLAFKVVSSSPV